MLHHTDGKQFVAAWSEGNALLGRCVLVIQIKTHLIYFVVRVYQQAPAAQAVKHYLPHVWRLCCASVMTTALH